jgi:uncharacterized protein (DUF362 family)
VTTVSRVALTTGGDVADNVYRALSMFRREIAAAIGARRVLIKPNVVIGTPDNGHGNVALSDTPSVALEGILEFLVSIGKSDLLIGESCATDPTLVGFEALGYFNLARRYPVRLIDLNQEAWEMVSIYNGTGTTKVRISSWLTNPDLFVISAPKIKTHNCVVATLSLKYVVLGSPIIDVGSYKSQAGAKSDKGSMHGQGNQDLNDNLHRLAPRVAPDLAVIDGYQTMEGNGPCWGTAVSHRVALASLDWLAADRVGVELMGIDPTWLGYLNYCAFTGMGQYDLDLIEVIGARVADHRRTYRLYDDCYNSQVVGIRPLRAPGHSAGQCLHAGSLNPARVPQPGGAGPTGY